MVGQLTVKKDIREGTPFYSLVNEHSTFYYHGKPALMESEHWHNHIEFNFIEQGQVRYLYDGKDVYFPSEQLIFFWGGIPHRMVDSQLDEKEGFYNFHHPLEDFLMYNFDPKLHRLLLSGHILTLKAPSVFLEQFFTLWQQDIQKNQNHLSSSVFAPVVDRSNFDISALFNRFSFEILSAPSTKNFPQAKKSTPNMALFAKILRFIFEHFQSDIKNQDIAEHLGYHENYIQRVFKDFSGHSIRQFIIHIRLKYACSLLRNTNRSIFNIAIETGFGSISRFYKAFVDHYQKTPKQYRQDIS